MVFGRKKIIIVLVLILLAALLTYVFFYNKKKEITFSVNSPSVDYGAISMAGNTNSEDNGGYEGADGEETSEEIADASYVESVDENNNGVSAETVYSISPLTIYCSTQGGTSSAKLELIGASIPSGIAITPEIPGNWQWVDENQLVFFPSKNWAPETAYSVKMMPDIFNSELKKKSRTVHFTTPPFGARVTSDAVSRAPGEEKTPRYTAQIDFTHSLDKESFENNIKLTLDGKPVKFNVTYNDVMRRALIRSEPVEILDHPRQFVMTGSGFTASGSKSKVQNELRSSKTVPDFSTFFYIKHVSSSIVRDSKNVPEQVVFLEFSDTISRKEVADNVKICLLPIAKDKNDDDSEYRDGWDNRDDNLKSKAQKYCTDKGQQPIIQGSSEGLSETIHPFLLDINTTNKKGDQQDRHIYVSFDKNVKSSSGFPLKDAVSSILKVPRYPKELFLTQDGAILTLSGDKTLTFSARGLDSVKISIGKLVDESQLQHIVVGTYSGGLKTNNFAGSRFGEDNFVSRKEQTISLPNSSPKEATYASINLGNYTDSRMGLYFVKASGKGVSEVNRIILVTDMGILMKGNKDGSSTVFVMSFADRRPVSNAKVDILGKNGLSVFSGYTDAGGKFDYPDLSELRNEKQPVAVVVKKGFDASFLPLNISERFVDYSRFPVGGVETEHGNKGLIGFIFTDRGIYRPGEEVNIGSIVKQADWRSLAGVAIEISVGDPSGKIVMRKRFSLSEEGILDFIYKTETVNPTGSYSIDMYLVENDRLKSHLGSSSFKVEEFEPDTMRIKASVIGKSVLGWQKPDNVSGYVKVDNMFGNPSSDRRIKWTVEVTPANFSDSDGYKFTDPNLDKTGSIRKVFTPDIPDGKTDSGGEARANLELNSIGMGTYILVMKCESFEPGSGDGVFSVDTATISSFDYLVGYKTLGDLKFVRRNSVQSVDFIAVNHEMKKIAHNDLKYRLVSIGYVMSLVKVSDGSYRYQSVEKRNVLDTGDFKIPENGLSYELPTGEAGRFVFEIISPENFVVGRVPFFVTGSTNLQSGIEKNAELVLQLNKTEYTPGETIDVNIISPYTGSGLITIERDKVYAYQWFRTNTTSSVQHITLPYGIEGNAYVNVSFVRDSYSKEIFINPHSYGIAPFSINKDKRNIKINLSAPDITVPGDEMLIKYSADKDTKLILYGVDEGILQVAGYTLPDPLSFFMKKQALSVSTSQTVDLILPEYRLIREAYATGGGEAAISKGLNPFARKTFKPSVFWASIINVKAGEEYEYKYTVPEYFNGTLKIMAVAASLDSVGSAVVSALARSPIVMLPNAPFAATEGDSFKVSVGVTNNIDGATGTSDIKITAKPSDNIVVTGEKSQTVSVPVGGERIVIFDVKTTDKIGAAEIGFIAENEKMTKPIKNTATLSIRPSSIYKTQLNVGKFTSASEDISGIFRDMHGAYSSRKLGVSLSPLAALLGLNGYLAEYPHGCSEQITSKIFPMIYLDAMADSDNAKTRQVFDDTINKLRSRQNGSDGFSMWSGYNSLNNNVSVYIMHFLTDAAAMGYNVPRQMMEDGQRFLSVYSSNAPSDLENARSKAYAAYLLARNGNVVSRQLANMEEYLDSQYKDTWKNDITAAFIGASYILMKENDKGKKLMEGVKPNRDRFISYSDYDSTSTRNSIYLYLLAKHDRDYMPKVSDIAEKIITDISNGYYNTISSAYAIVALGAYSPSEMETAPQVTAYAGKSTTLVPLNGKIHTGAFNAGTDKIAIKYPEKNTDGRFYYVLQSGFDKKTPGITNNGLEIIREFYDAAGKKTGEVKQGDEITVKIRVRITGKDVEYINNAVITDLLAGGVEVMRKDGIELGDNYDIREDRVLIYTQLNKAKSQEFSYKLKALSVGSFIVPPIFAEDMYKSSVYGNSGKSTIKINGLE